MAPLAWDTEQILPWGAELTEDLSEDFVMEWARVLYTAWQLMTQHSTRPLTDEEHLPRPRAGRRRDERAGINSTGVRVVRLHAGTAPAAPTSTTMPNGRAAAVLRTGHAAGRSDHTGG